MLDQNKTSWITATVVSRTDETDSIISIELASSCDTPLPPFTPGSHVDIQATDNIIRQYSICNDALDTGIYRLGILLDEHSRGGSRALHQQLVPEAQVSISQPRNLFPLVEEATSVTLVAGGIGITPLLSMAYALEHQGTPFNFHVCTRNSASIPFGTDLLRWDKQTKLHFSDAEDPEHPPLNAENDIGTYTKGDYLYICGPEGFMEFVRESALALGWPSDSIRIEHFSADVDTHGEAFHVEAHRSGISVSVGPDESIAEALSSAGVEIPISCEQGICGTCMTQVLEGVPDHRDLYMTDLEHAENKFITICCSRSKSSTLVLDI